MTRKIKKIIKLSVILTVGLFGIIGSVLDNNIDGQVILSGPISEASYEILVPNISRPLYRGIATKGDNVDINSSGLLTIMQELVDMNISTEMLFKLTKSDFYIIQAHGGVDVDTDLDGIWDKKPTINNGKLHLILSPKALNSKVFKINILTEIIYQSMKDIIIADIYTTTEIETMIDEQSKKLLLSVENGGDLNSDGIVDYNDIILWSPISYKDKLKVNYNKEIVPIIQMVKDGKDIHVQANQVLEEFIWKIESISQDIEGDGNIDKKITYSYNKNALLSKEEIDLHADGLLDEVKIYSYDTKKRLSKLEVDLLADDNIDEITTYSYNNKNDLTLVETKILASGLISKVEYNYDKDRHLTKEEKSRSTDGVFETTIYKYDSENGTLISKEIIHPMEKAGDTLVTYIYDEKLNLIEENIDYHKDQIIDSKISYIYKTSGNLEKKIENYEKNTWTIFSIKTYNSNGLLIKEESSFNGKIPNRIKSYDKYGNEFKSEVDIKPDGTYEKVAITLNSYDKFGNLTQIADEDGNVIESREWKKVK